MIPRHQSASPRLSLTTRSVANNTEAVNDLPISRTAPMPKLVISIDVGDLQKATDFYVGALACERSRDHPHPHVAVLSAGAVEIYLLEKPAGSKPIPGSAVRRSYERHWTSVHLDFYVDDIGSTLQRIADNNGTCEFEGVSGDRFALCADPFGNGFCIIQEQAANPP